MTMKRIDYAIQALKAISDGTLLTADDLRNIAFDGLEKIGAVEKASRDKLNETAAGLLMAGGAIFFSAEEIAKFLNEKGLKTVRNGEWTKSTATVLMQDVRPIIEQKMAEWLKLQGVLASAVPEPIKPAAEPEAADIDEDADVLEEAPVVAAAPAPATAASVVSDVLSGASDGDDELTELLQDLDQAAA